MTASENSRSFSDAVSVIPMRIRAKLFLACRDIEDRITDVVIRAERPVTVSTISGLQYLCDNSVLTNSTEGRSLCVASSSEVLECFNNICGYSVYSHLREIKEGFVTLKGGHRAGITGTAVISSDEIMNVRDISGISIRIARQMIGCGEKIASDFMNISGGLLICGSPSSGKTTVLRDIARLLSTQYRQRVSLVDTRGELAAMKRGVPQNEIGCADVLDGYPRAEGIEQAVRCLSPDVIVCDEIGSSEDTNALLSSVNSGVRFVATAHAGSVDEILYRKNIVRLIEQNAFGQILLLKGKDSPGEIKSAMSSGELLNV